MGREIRRVPPDWEHPKEWNCRQQREVYKALYDRPYSKAIAEWVKDYLAWQENPEDDCPFWEWEGPPPDPDYYRPDFEQEPTAYQIYENVSEGTPVSPVFETLDGMRVWLLDQGYSEHATDMFIETGYAPSMVFSPGKGVSGLGIHSLDHLKGKEGEE